MKFKHHLIIGFVASFIVIKFFNFSLFEGIIIFTASILIDFDHYLWYVNCTKDKNPFNAIRWYKKHIKEWYKFPIEERRKHKKEILIFHSLPLLAIIYFLSFINPFFLLIFLGMTIHITSDILNKAYHKESPRDKTFPLYTWIKNKGKKDLFD